jgi:hypothetical protein
MCSLFMWGYFVAFACGQDESASDHSRSSQALVSRLDDSDLVWSIDCAAQIHLHFTNEAAEIARSEHPPISMLVDALDDPAHAIPAYLLLCELAFGPGCALLCDSDEVGYHGMNVQFERPDSKKSTLRANYPDRVNWRDSLVTDLVLVGIDELQKLSDERRKKSARRDARGVSLKGRTRNVDEVANGDINWSIAGFANLRWGWSEKAQQIVEQRPSIEGLLDALNDPDRFVVAHMMLVSEYFPESRVCCRSFRDGYVFAYRGLRGEVSVTERADARGIRRIVVSFPDSDAQRQRLELYWDQVTSRRGSIRFDAGLSDTDASCER